MKKLGEQIRQARLHKGLTQEELADLTKITLRTVQRIEKGENTPRIHTIRSIAEELEINLEGLLETLTLKPVKPIGNLIMEGFFLVVFNLVLMGIIGFLTLDSEANLNSRFAGVVISFFLPFFLVYKTRNMAGFERTLKFGSGLILYIGLVWFLHGFPLGFTSLLFPCLTIALTVLYYGNYLLHKEA